MSYYLCPHCDERHEIFGHGGGRQTAKRLDIDFLGEIPLDEAIREGGDRGTPTMLAEPDSPRGEAFVTIARGVVAALAA